MARRRHVGRTASVVAIHAVLIAAALLMAFPFYWMVMTTLKPEGEVFTSQIQLFPSALSLAAYA